MRSRERVDLLLELGVDGRDCGAADARAVEVLEGDEERDDARLLLALGVARRERHADAGVVDRVARGDVRVQLPDELVPVRRARARDVDVVHALAVARAVGAVALADTEVGHERGVNATSRRRGGRSRGSGSRGRRRRRRCSSRDSGDGVRAVLDSLNLRAPRRRDLRASDTRTMEVLERDGRGVEACEGGRLGVVLGEGELDSGVVDRVAGGDVRVELANELAAVGRARARDVGVVDTLAVTEREKTSVRCSCSDCEDRKDEPSAVRGDTLLNTELRNEGRVDITTAEGEGADGDRDGGSREEGGGKLHDEIRVREVLMSVRTRSNKVDLKNEGGRGVLLR